MSVAAHMTNDDSKAPFSAADDGLDERCVVSVVTTAALHPFWEQDVVVQRTGSSNARSTQRRKDLRFQNAESAEMLGLNILPLESF